MSKEEALEHAEDLGLKGKAALEYANEYQAKHPLMIPPGIVVIQ